MAAPKTKVLLLGGEGSGKTTLLAQLRALARSDGREALPPAAHVAPTTGQEIETMTFRPARLVYASGLAPAAAAEAAAADAPPDFAGDEPPPSDATELTIYEAGGRMMSVWPRYIKGQLRDGGARALMYMLDCSNPVQLPTAAAGLYEVLARPERDVRAWDILLLVNKARMPSAMRPRDVLALVGVRALLDAAAAVCARRADGSAPLKMAVAVVDTWTGEGLDDVVLWLLQLPRAATCATA
jgi:hypothetical protein